MKKLLALLCVAAATAASARFMDSYRRHLYSTPSNVKQIGDFSAKADYFAAGRATGELLATGNVHAAALPYRFHSDRVSRNSDLVATFGPNTLFTTCTNHTDHLHWSLSNVSPVSWISDGEFTYEEGVAVRVRNAWLRLSDVPVFWVPYWYYPLNTDYGWRFMPGYTTRWGGYLLSGYVYNIVNEGSPDKPSLGGSSYVDYRTKNGFAVGQTLRWDLLDFGRGRFNVFHAWDEDYDRYSRHWDDHRYNHRNWGSPVDHERYRLHLEHYADVTERDSVRANLTWLSDSYLMHDFLRRQFLEESYPANEISYEHRELSWAAGGTVSGPLNRFYGGVARLPEAWVNVAPQPIFFTPFNYESQSRAGFLNRQFSDFEEAMDPLFRYRPFIGEGGRGADYQAFRVDSAHRVSLPFKLWDVLSVVPRASYRGTYWSDSGDAESNFMSASGSAVYRNIYEFGFTAAARASAWLNDSWRHTFEPYLDYSFQGVELSGSKTRRHYCFDSFDRSLDWLDQFGMEGRGLPFNWHGIRPGVRNLFQNLDSDNFLRSVMDFDIYAAIPFDSINVYEDGPLAGYPIDPADGHYNRRGGDRQVVPGTRIRVSPFDSVTLNARAEYDCQNSKVAYADLILQHSLADSFQWYFGYLGRDHRYWDYLPSEYDRFNYTLSNSLAAGFRHDICHWLSYSPFIRYDARRNEVEEVGAWVDFLTDCLGYRVMAEYDSSYRRLDGSKYDSDVRIVFFIYLRALGSDSMLDLAKF